MRSIRNGDTGRWGRGPVPHPSTWASAVVTFGRRPLPFRTHVMAACVRVLTPAPPAVCRCRGGAGGVGFLGWASRRRLQDLRPAGLMLSVIG